MVFNSLEYFLFLPMVFVLYWFVFKSHLKLQNTFLLVASYVFYGWWDWRFLSLILISTLVDFFVAKRIYVNEQPTKRKAWVFVSILFNIGLLGFFKYYNFFIDSWVVLVSFTGYHIKSTWTLQVILPVGISFYTFQTMSYSFDVYYKKLKPTNDFLSFAAFVSFFPQLVAGPIERASNLLTQILKKRSFNYQQSADGLKLILWGLFKKVAIADSLGVIVDDIFLNYQDYSTPTLIMGVIFFSFQIYGDFSGYSDIAIGTAKLFGIELMSNFKFPYFSRNIGEFWRRWHISLSSWFKAYLYIPLGGSHEGTLNTLRNILIIFIVSGFWHGANWTFIVWGAFHAFAFIPLFLRGKNKVYKDKRLGNGLSLLPLQEMIQIIFTFAIVAFSWIFFRAETITDALAYIWSAVTQFDYSPYLHPKGYRMIDYFVLIILFILYEYIIRNNERLPYPFKSKFVRFFAYVATVFGILMFYDSSIDRSFIYFQF